MNETLLIASAVIDIGLVLLACYLGRSWIFATIVLNMVLISVLGQKIVPVFGFETNVGNVFYVAVFLGVYLLLEYGTKMLALRAMWMGVGTIVSLSVLLQLTLGMQSAESTAAVSDAMRAALGDVPRVAIASILGFLAAVSLTISLYAPAHDELAAGSWPVRTLVLIMLAQLVDSVLFFTVAFWGTLATGAVIESIIAGYLIKVVLSAMTMPLIRMCRNFQPVV